MTSFSSPCTDSPLCQWHPLWLLIVTSTNVGLQREFTCSSDEVGHLGHLQAFEAFKALEALQQAGHIR